MADGNTNRTQSVSAVCIRDGKVLLGRHTYGAGNGKLVIPGGYMENRESPQAAVRREYLEETGVVIEPQERSAYGSTHMTGMWCSGRRMCPGRPILTVGKTARWSGWIPGRPSAGRMCRS